FILLTRQVVDLVNGIAQFLDRDGAPRVDGGGVLEFGGGALKIALFAEFLALFDVVSAGLKAHLVVLDAVIGVLRIGCECFLVILQCGVVVLKIFRFAGGLVVIVALGAASG